MKRRLRAIDLCGGGGGWAVAARGLPVEIAVAVDWWEPAVLTYRQNHPDTLVVRADCRNIPVRPEGFDVVLGGIPCQWLVKGLRSKAVGNQASAEEILRETELLGALLDWTREAAPRWWCFEDVVWLSPHLPLFTPQRVLNSRAFCGQRRKRLYVGVFPDPVPNGKGALTAKAYMRPGPYRWNPRNLGKIPRKHRGYGNDKSLYPIRREEKWPTAMSIGSRYDVRFAVERGSGWRQVEWQEAALAQGFPEDYVFVGNMEQTAKMVANAVQIDTARAILEGIVARAKTGRGDA